MRITYPTLIAAATLALLSACATTDGSSASANGSQASGATTTPAATVVNSQPAPTQPEIKVTPVAFEDGTVAVFTKTGTALEQADVDYLAQYASTFKKAKAIHVVGHCDRSDNMLGAQRVALARAASVRTELIKLGVPSSKIRLKYLTETDRHSVSILRK